MPIKICAVAVDVGTFALDKLYDYILPKALAAADVGCRVLVPFGKGNRRVEGIIAAFRENSSYETEKLKTVYELLDDIPVLDAGQIKLAAWMRSHLYCTFYECTRVILPTGLWLARKDSYTLQGDAEQVQALAGQEFARLLSIFTADTPTRTLEEIRALLPSYPVMGHLDELCRRESG